MHAREDLIDYLENVSNATDYMRSTITMKENGDRQYCQKCGKRNQIITEAQKGTSRW